MKDWIVRSLPRGTRLHSYHGAQPGGVVHVIGWTGDGSVDVRQVVSLEVAQCDGGVMLWLDRPLRNQVAGGAWVSLAWTREGGKRP